MASPDPIAILGQSVDCVLILWREQYRTTTSRQSVDSLFLLHNDLFTILAYSLFILFTNAGLVKFKAVHSRLCYTTLYY